MDRMAPRDKDLELDLENGVTVSEEEEDYSRSPVSGLKKKAQLLLAKVKGSFAVGSELDDRLSLSGDASNSGRVYVENVQKVRSMNIEGQESKDGKENKLVKEKRKSLSNKKPPRPPRAASLDAADQELIRELAELARLKRARVERMKALKKMKAAKGTSSNSNMFAMVFTVIVCLVIIFQGMPSKGTQTSFQGSGVPAGAMEAEGGLIISVEFFGNGNPSASIPNRPDSGSP